ncbi:MAG: DUF1003 domain-containing protein [Pyrinomonadaceae bacterium]|nr:DUF1003 domain-containing protein [Pyrinomonadaceae bacterium]
MSNNKVVSQSEIIRKNISAVIEMQRKESEAHTLQDKVADAITRFSGSMAFVYLHALWFGIWILLNIGLLHIPHISEFDPFPFGLLTMIVSLEAIFLSTFILVSQNRDAAVNAQRSELDLQVNLLAEQKATKVLETLDHIAQQLNNMSSRFNFAPDPELEALKQSPAPQEVLKVMEEAVKEGALDVQERVEEVVEEITGELDVVRSNVERVSEQVETVASDVSKIKQGIEEQTGEHKLSRSK